MSDVIDSLISHAYQAYNRRLLLAAYAIARDWSDAQDCTQEAWIRFVKTLRAGKEIRTPKPWLLVTVRRISLDLVKQRTRREKNETVPQALIEPEDDEHGNAWSAIAGPENIEESVVVASEVNRVLLIVREVTDGAPNWRGLIELTAEGYGPREIATRLGVTEKTVDSRLHRLRENLRTRIDPSRFPPTPRRERSYPSQTAVSAWYPEAKRLRAQGWTIKDIATELGKSIRSVHVALNSDRERAV